MQETWVQSLGQEDPLEKGIPVFLPGEFNGQRSLAGYSPWGCKELDRTEQLTLMAATGGGESLTSPVSTKLGSPGTFPAA